MCGRKVCVEIHRVGEIMLQLKLPFQDFFDSPPNWNAAPSQQLPVIINVEGVLQMHPMHWGLIPGWLKPGEQPKMTPINARAETIAEKPMFRNLVKRRRCLVPANGFYEWKSIGGSKQPYYIHLADQPFMLMAGLYDVRSDEDGEDQPSHTIITGPPNDVMAEIHDRMPMIIRPEDVELWMDDEIREIEPLEPLLQPLTNDEIAMYPVSTAVNNARHNGPELIEPIAIQEGLL